MMYPLKMLPFFRGLARLQDTLMQLHCPSDASEAQLTSQLRQSIAEMLREAPSLGAQNPEKKRGCFRGEPQNLRDTLW